MCSVTFCSSVLFLHMMTYSGYIYYIHSSISYCHGVSFCLYMYISAPQSKNAVSTNIKHRRYIHLMSNFLSIHFYTRRLYVHMFDLVDTPFSYGRGLIVCSSLQEFSKTKESTLHVIWNGDTAFLLCGADTLVCFSFTYWQQ